eukprot:TRINITY_DN31453_c0_g1_i1.p1 TRINITY_DN31453_c0_g1~~TRINITY_DN31453_c0_g1_i1.p1  ORF type:complete len:109 (+),score=42.69 TRINITY_DN31453_c0_g1_i1:53-379(+)
MSDESLEACKGKVGMMEEDELLRREEDRILKQINKNVDEEAVRLAEINRQEEEERAVAARIKLEKRLALANAEKEKKKRQEQADLEKEMNAKKYQAANLLSSFINNQK